MAQCKTFRVWYVIEGETSEYATLIPALNRAAALAAFSRRIADTDEDSNGRNPATVTRVECLSPEVR